MALRRPLAWLNKRRSWKITYHAPALPVSTLEITKRSPHRPPYNTSVPNQIDQIFPSNHYLSNSDYGIFVDRGLRTACCLVDAAASKQRRRESAHCLAMRVAPVLRPQNRSFPKNRASSRRHASYHRGRRTLECDTLWDKGSCNKLLVTLRDKFSPDWSQFRTNMTTMQQQACRQIA